MQRPLGLFIRLVSFCWLLLAAVPAQAQSGAESDINAVLERWSQLYASSTSPDEIVALYAPDATFWGTGSTAPFIGRDSFAPYFARQFQSFTDRSVSFHDQTIEVYADQFATDIGTYEFHVTASNGEKIVVRHRFSFAFVKLDGTWQIAQQHSSAMPQS